MQCRKSLRDVLSRERTKLKPATLTLLQITYFKATMCERHNRPYLHTDMKLEYPSCKPRGPRFGR